MDVATRELIEEIAHLRSMVPLDSVNGLILQERWQQQRKKVKEDMSSSQSGLHFDNYIPGTDCDYISQFHALQVLLSLKKGIALEQWPKGLSVMSEKMFGKRLVSKLWAILLMDADFNRRTKRCMAFECWTTCKDTNLSRRKFSVNRIKLPTMGVWQKCCFMISPVRRALRLPSRPWMRLTVTIG